MSANRADAPASSWQVRDIHSQDLTTIILNNLVGFGTIAVGDVVLTSGGLGEMLLNMPNTLGTPSTADVTLYFAKRDLYDWILARFIVGGVQNLISTGNGTHLEEFRVDNNSLIVASQNIPITGTLPVFGDTTSPISLAAQSQAISQSIMIEVNATVSPNSTGQISFDLAVFERYNPYGAQFPFVRPVQRRVF